MNAVDHKKVFRMKSTVALVYKESKLDIFLANTREQFIIEIEYENIIELLFSFDGFEDFEAIAKNHAAIDEEELYTLISYLNEKRALIEVDTEYDQEQLKNNYRLICLLEDYHTSTSGVLDALRLLASKSVMIVGLGAVGTWIADALVRTGVMHLTLVDDDYRRTLQSSQAEFIL